ncbi:MAG: DUF1080 domain-containing protein, partial [Candidatus Hydrogenedentes bacterium]|nr:DUF1080 domain-containing protein [Candidatus Hydrogenedentota bacterium]
MKRMVAVLMILAMAGCARMSAMIGKDRPVTPNKKIVLWNGTDFTGWKLFGKTVSQDDPKWTVREFSPGDQGCEWSIGDGVIQCTGVPSGYMRTTTSYADYKLHVEWRWPGEAGNSGVLVHMNGQDKAWPKCIECQLKSKNAGDFYVINGTEFKEHKEMADGGRRVPRWGDTAEKPLGQW